MDKRVAIVTGASRGIGCAIAQRFAADGHHVVLVARSAEPMKVIAGEIESAGGSASVRACDMGDASAVTALVESVAGEYSRLDILVNNAGVTRDGLILRMSDDDFDTVINVNLKAAFVACRSAARPMMRGRFGRIINVGSVTGLMGNPGQANYAAAKAGLAGMTRTLAKELGSKGITANVIAPGFVDTAMTDALPAAVKEEAAKRVPLKRFGQPEEIAHTASFLASEQAGYLTGQTIVVDGGLTC